MESREKLEQQQQQVLEAMGRLGPMKRGSLSEQYLRVPQKGQRTPALRGPYFVLSRKQGGKTVSQRVAPGEVARVRREMARYDRFVELSREFVELSEQLGALVEEEDTLKKTLKLPSRKTRK